MHIALLNIERMNDLRYHQQQTFHVQLHRLAYPDATNIEVDPHPRGARGRRGYSVRQ